MTASPDLPTFSANAGDKASERVYIQKAYDLRESATEPVRLYITAHYHSAITEDLYESLRTYQLWTNLYPRSFGAWTGLAEIERQLDHVHTRGLRERGDLVDGTVGDDDDIEIRTDLDELGQGRRQCPFLIVRRNHDECTASRRDSSHRLRVPSRP